MTTNPTARITALLASTTLSPPNHAEILALTQPPASQKPKNSRPQNLETLHTHVVALLKLDRDEDALRILETEGGEALRERAGLEFAYALYKCGRLEEARMVAGRVADGVGEEGKERGAKHVEAQAVSAAFLYIACCSSRTEEAHERDYDLPKGVIRVFNGQLLMKMA